MSVFTDQVTVTNTPLPIDTTGQTINVGNFPATQPISGTVTANAGTGPFPVSDNGGSLTVDGTVAVTQSTSPWVVSGTLSTSNTTSNSATITQVTSSGTNQTILAANANRKRAILFFSSGIWNVKLGATASSTSFTYLVNASNTTIELPIWTGQIDAICTTASKLVNVTELV